MRKSLFTSESVAMGHPDKVADQISDAVLDAIIKQDPDARVACETMVNHGVVLVGGEITTKCYVNITEIVRNTLKQVGYVSADDGIAYDACGVLVAIDRQSPDISQGVTEGQGLHKEQGAGDQGLMFGYACNETPELMPLPIMLAHQLMEKLAQARETKEIGWLRPDGKCQVTVEYHDGKPARVHTVVLSAQHKPEIPYDTIQKTLIEKVVKKAIPAKWLDKNTIYHINPTGRFVVGGPQADCGCTGRKIIVDTYGGKGAHGGGAFSGKDPSKVDRSACYMARYAAKNIVAAGIADRCEVQVAYAIGVAEPVSILVNCEGTSRIPEEKIEEILKKNFDFRPKQIIEYLNLKRPIYFETARHGHFGRTGENFTWEKTDKAEILRKAAGLQKKSEQVGAGV